MLFVAAKENQQKAGKTNREKRKNGDHCFQNMRRVINY